MRPGPLGSSERLVLFHKQQFFNRLFYSELGLTGNRGFLSWTGKSLCRDLVCDSRVFLRMCVNNGSVSSRFLAEFFPILMILE